jgi:hypothetical protein
MLGSSKPPPFFAFQFYTERKKFFRRQNQRQREGPKTAYDSLPRLLILLPALNKEVKEADMMTHPPVREVQSSKKFMLPFKRI